MAKQCPTCKKTYPEDQAACPHCQAEAAQKSSGDEIAIDWDAMEELGKDSGESPSGSDVIQLAVGDTGTPDSDVVQILAPDSGPELMEIVQPNAGPADSSVVQMALEEGGSKIGSDVFLEEDLGSVGQAMVGPGDAGPAMSSTVAAFMPAPELEEAPEGQAGERSGTPIQPPQDAGPAMSSTMAAFMEYPGPEKDSPKTQHRGGQAATMIDIGDDAGAGAGKPTAGGLEEATPSRLNIPAPEHGELVSGLEIPDEDLHGGSPSSGTLARAFLEDADEAPLREAEARAEDREEEPAGVDEVEVHDEEPTRRPGQRWDVRSGVGGGVLGLLLGVVACLALWMVGMEPPASWRKAKPPAPPQPLAAPSVAVAPPPAAAPAAAPVAALSPLEQAAQHMGRGELEKAVQVLRRAEGSSPELLARRGEAVWLHYLTQKRIKHETPSAQDAEVAEARKALTESNTALGLFWLGQMEENLGQMKEARQTYERGLKKFPGEQPRFQAAIDRLEALESEQDKAAGETQSQGPRTDRVAALLLVALQTEPPPPPKPGVPLPSAPSTRTTGKAGTGSGSKPAKPPEPRAETSPSPKTEAPRTAAGTTPRADEEAGSEFWKAVRLARAQKYDQAIAALRQARELHEQRRYARLNQSQNPVSDPTEQIFLRSCDEILKLWEIQDQLKAAGLPTRPGQIVKAVQSSGKSGPGMDAVVERLRQEKLLPAGDNDVARAVGRLLDERKQGTEQLAAIRAALEEAKLGGEADPAAGVKKLTAERQTAAYALAGIREVLKSAGVGGDEETNVARAVEKLVEAKKAADAQAKETADKLQAADSTLEEVTRRLTEAKYVEPPAGRAGLLPGLERALTDASSPIVTALAHVADEVGQAGAATASRLVRGLDLAGRLAASEARNVRYRAELLQTRTPRQMLDVWAELMRDPRNADQADAALADARRVADDTSAEPATRAEAMAVEGLALRNQGKLAEARKRLDQAMKESGTAEGHWQVAAREALRELSDPNVYFLPQAARLASAGRVPEALAYLDRAAEVFPAGSRQAGQVLALRAVMRLDLARAQAGSSLRAKDPAVIEARRDAEAAVAAGAVADGEYALGVAARETGDWAAAESGFRKALAAHPDPDAAGNRCRLALAAVLIQRSHRPRTTPADDATRDRTGQAPGERDERTVQVSRKEPANRASGADGGLDQAIELASQAIHAGDARGYLIKAEALAKQERWNEALTEYLTGLGKLTPGGYAAGLRDVIENHPAFRMPVPLARSQPMTAEAHFMKGSRLYWAGRYTAAEDEFAEAVRQNPQDARYYYFLGLARLQGGRPADAYEAFRQGGQREAQGKPSSAEVGAALERVQGQVRRVLDREAHRGG